MILRPKLYHVGIRGTFSLILALQLHETLVQLTVIAVCTACAVVGIDVWTACAVGDVCDFPNHIETNYRVKSDTETEQSQRQTQRQTQGQGQSRLVLSAGT